MQLAFVVVVMHFAFRFVYLCHPQQPFDFLMADRFGQQVLVVEFLITVLERPFDGHASAVLYTISSQAMQVQTEKKDGIESSLSTVKKKHIRIAVVSHAAASCLAVVLGLVRSDFCSARLVMPRTEKSA